MFYFAGMTMQQIRQELEELGVVLTDEQFFALTYAELTKIGKKAYKIYKLNNQINTTIGKSSDPSYYHYDEFKA